MMVPIPSTGEEDVTESQKLSHLAAQVRYFTQYQVMNRILNFNKMNVCVILNICVDKYLKNCHLKMVSEFQCIHEKV